MLYERFRRGLQKPRKKLLLPATWTDVPGPYREWDWADLLEDWGVPDWVEPPVDIHQIRYVLSSGNDSLFVGSKLTLRGTEMERWLASSILYYTLEMAASCFRMKEEGVLGWGWDHRIDLITETFLTPRLATLPELKGDAVAEAVRHNDIVRWLPDASGPMDHFLRAVLNTTDWVDNLAEADLAYQQNRFEDIIQRSLIALAWCTGLPTNFIYGYQQHGDNTIVEWQPRYITYETTYGEEFEAQENLDTLEESITNLYTNWWNLILERLPFRWP